MPDSVLVITRVGDITADLVIRQLDERGVPVHRFDLADLRAGSLRVTAELAGTGRRWIGSLQDGHRDTDLSSVSAAWWRKPSDYGSRDGTEQAWMTAEAEFGLGGLLAALPDVRWINHPHRNRLADDKPRQLSLAAKAGLAVPATLITNDPVAARIFVARQTNGAVYKPLRGGPRTPEGDRLLLHTELVTVDQINDGVRTTTHLFQERVPCAFSVRVTSIGDRVFAVRIDTQDSEILDWRADHDRLSYSPIEIPAEAAAGLAALNRELGLVYSASDWIVTPDGTWTFLENNPNGQWAWLEQHTGLPLTSALVDALTIRRTTT
ncbi:ATP-grasp ribosomal peptide maturase [Actinoalloteichus sp. GBA129-24]|nr:ATP-grasp ribosomal peptide maturase [Actinoalloteichus sp. GBA129-24]